MSQTVYVTGAEGAIGCVVSPHLALTHRVVPLGRAAAPQPEAAWFDPAESEAALVHLATEFSARTPGDASASAALQIEMARRLVARGWRGRMVFASSAAVYPEAPEPIAETAAPGPVNPYGIHKLAVERGLADLARNSGFTLSVLRFANVYGSPLDLSRRRVCALLIDAARHGTPFTLIGDGSSLRDYVHVTDAAEAIRAALAAPPGLFNIGSGTGTRLIDLIATVEAITGRRIELRREKTHAEAAASVLDPSLAQAALGWRPRIVLDDGLRALATLMGA